MSFCRHVVQTDDNRHDFTKFRQNTETTTSYDVFTNFFFSHFAALTQQQQRPGSLNTWKQTEDFKNSWTYSWLAAARQTDQQQHYEQKCQNIAHKLRRLFHPTYLGEIWFNQRPYQRPWIRPSVYYIISL